MIELIKNKIWAVLQNKDVSLVMIYNRQGEILWHQGRPVKGRTLSEGGGFSSSLIRELLHSSRIIEKENQFIQAQHSELPGSALFLRIKSILILPLPHNLFLYVDSGSKEQFSQLDREIFHIMGELLGECIIGIVSDRRPLTEISGVSPATERIRELILKYSLENDPILLLGETGVGKSHIAQVIHSHSGRKGRFLTVNTPAIPENLFESEIFGHKRGAFTDAKNDRPGAIETAEGGTLFFDEIADIPLSFQAKLLHFLETRRYSVLGESRERRADIRIIAATNRDLGLAINQGQFREDLYYRLQVLEITIPPLRNRKEDIRDLIERHPELLRNKSLDSQFWSAMLAHDWPGNIRELFSVLKRLALLDSLRLGPDEVREVLLRGQKNLPNSLSSCDLFSEAQKRIAAGESFWETVWPLFIERHISRSDLQQFLLSHFQDHNSGIKALAERLNIPASDFKKFIAVLHKYAIHPRKKRSD